MHYFKQVALCVLAVCASANVYAQPLSTRELAAKIQKKEQLTTLPTMYITLVKDANGADIPAALTDNNLATYLYKQRNSSPDVDDVAPYSQATLQIVDNQAGADNLAMEENRTTEDGILALQIKVRGNATSGLDKKPYRLKFAKDEKEADGVTVRNSYKHDLINGDNNPESKKLRNWTLLANAYDKTMMRNALAYHLGQYVGMAFCPRYRFVDLVINGNYRGVYQISDQVEEGSVRVPIKENSGWLVEFNDKGDQQEYPYIAASNGVPGVNIKNPSWSKDNPNYRTKNDSLIAEIKKYNDELWGTAFNIYSSTWNGPNGYKAYIDLTDLVNYYIASEVTANGDAMISVYAYRETLPELDQKLHFGPLWDFDLAFGNCSNWGDISETKVCDVDNTSSIKWKFQKMWEDPEFVIAMKNRFDQLLAAGLKAQLAQDIETLRTLLEGPQAQNYAEYGTHQWDLNAGGYNGINIKNGLDDFDAYVNHMKQYTMDRIDWLEKTINEAYAQIPQSDIVFDPRPQSNWDSNGTYTSLYSINGQLATTFTISPRTIVGSQWNTFCVPFNATEAQIKEALGGKDFDIREFSRVDGSTMVFTEPAGKAIVCGTPYLIKLKDATATVTDPVFKNVMVGTSANNATTVNIDNYQFVGIYHGQALTDYSGKTLFLGKDDELYRPANPYAGEGNNIIYGTRAYFIVPSTAGAKLSISDSELQQDGGTPTAISLTESVAPDAPATVYNISGQAVGTATDRLPRGIYIVNGKKIVK